ncbi:MAG: uroporphyrinogen decarboxylase family protein [Armatimonadota bacterium]
MSNTQISHRERVRLALDHKETDRIPIAMVCSGINPPAYMDLSAWFREKRGISVEEYLKPLLDVACVGPVYTGPILNTGTDIWGVRRKPVSYGQGAYDEIEHYPLASADSPDQLDNNIWPSTDWFDYESLPGIISDANKDGEYCLMASGGNIFETAWYMRGFERMFEDMILNPELVIGIMERVTDFYTAHTRKILEASDGKIDLIFTADDIGGQQGLLMSIGMWEEFIKPYHVKLNSVIHEFGAKVIYHSDGAVMDALPGLVDMGIDILQALQFDAKGMDPCIMKEQFGNKLCFEGGISVQSTLPFGSADDVVREVDERIRVLGMDGGYILGPSHAIQAGTPPENIVAMFDTAAGSLQGND